MGGRGGSGSNGGKSNAKKFPTLSLPALGGSEKQNAYAKDIVMGPLKAMRETVEMHNKPNQSKYDKTIVEAERAAATRYVEMANTAIKNLENYNSRVRTGTQSLASKVIDFKSEFTNLAEQLRNEERRKRRI